YKRQLDPTLPRRSWIRKRLQKPSKEQRRNCPSGTNRSG
ncbi:hypothetical protein E2320_000736, partial [Naja naja]